MHRLLRPVSFAMAGLLIAACSDGTATAPTATTLGSDASTNGRSIEAAAFAAPLDLGTLGGGYSYAWDVNEAGTVVGVSTLADGSSHAFRWSAATGMQDLGTLGGASSAAYAINAAGYIVGGSQTADGVGHVALWAPDGTIRDLGTIPGAVNAYGTAINDRNQVAGDVIGGETSGYTAHVVTWSDATGLVEEAFGCGDIVAAAIGRTGDLAGTTGCSATAHGDYGAWWKPVGGIVQDLGGAPDAERTITTGMNDVGQTVGYAQDDATSMVQAWLRSPGSPIATLLTAATGQDISNRGEVVGGGSVIDGTHDAFYWHAQVGKVTLPGLGGTFSSAIAITGNGQRVAGYALDPAGQWRAVLWRRLQPGEAGAPALAAAAVPAAAARPLRTCLDSALVWGDRSATSRCLVR